MKGATKGTKVTKDICALCELLRAEALAIFNRPDEPEDQVSEVSRRDWATTVCQHVNPIVVTGVFRIAQQVTKVLHSHERSEEERVKHDLLLDECLQCLRSRKL